MDCSVYILNDRRQLDLPVPWGWWWFVFGFFLMNFSESCHKKRFDEIAFVMISWQARSLILWYFDRRQGGDGVTQGLAVPPVLGQAALRQLSEKNGKSKATGAVQCLPVTVTSMCFTNACEFSFTAPLWGMKLLLLLLQKNKAGHKEIKLFSWGLTGSLW